MPLVESEEVKDWNSQQDGAQTGGDGDRLSPQRADLKEQASKQEEEWRGNPDPIGSFELGGSAAKLQQHDNAS